MSNLIDVIYFPGDDRALDASEVVKDLCNASLARANELKGTEFGFNWLDESDDARLTVGLRVLKRMESLGISMLDDQNRKHIPTLDFLIDSDLATLQGKYPNVTEGDLPFIRDAAQSLKTLNVLVPAEGVLETIKRVGYAYKGATGTLSGKGTPSSINVFIRKKLNSDACVRDFKNVAPRTFHKANVNMAVFTGIEGVTSDTPHLEGTEYTDAKIITSKSEAIVQKAFEYARDNNIEKVYVAQKGNILKESDNAFVEFGRKYSAEFGIDMEYIIFDNFLQRITKNPDWFKVIVTTNFYGNDFLLPLARAMFNRVDSADLGANVGSFDRFEGQNTDYTTTAIDTRCYRQNNEGFYIGEDKRTETESINFRRITRKMSENVIRYALDDTIARGKNNLFVLYSPNLAGDQLFLKVGKEIASEDKYANLDVRFRTIPEYCLYTVKYPELIDGVVGTNLTMDFLTDAEASKIGGIGMMPSFNYTLETGTLISEPGHGTAPDLSENQINPGASIWAAAALLEHMGNDTSGRLNDSQKSTLLKASELLYQGTTDFYAAGENLTGDLGGTGSTLDVGEGIKARLATLN
jgi:isocitrate dehydrogenase (NAD+)